MITLLRMVLFLTGLWCLALAGAGLFLRAQARHDMQRQEDARKTIPRESLDAPPPQPNQQSYVMWKSCHVVRNVP